MNPSRRSFLKQWGILAVGVSAVPGLGWTAEISVVTKELKLSDAERAVLRFVKGYSRRLRLVGTGLSGKLRGRDGGVVNVLAEIDDAALLDGVWTSGGVPFKGVYAAENTLSFTHEGTPFAVENLLPDAFASRLAELHAGRGLHFAHEALSWNPVNSALHDPFRVADDATLTLIHPGRDVAASFDTVLRGWIDAEAQGLAESEGFTRFEARVLGASAGRRTAAGVVGALSRRLAAIPSAKLKDLFRSPIVTSSAPRASIANFKMLRANIGSECNDATIWLALVLAPQLSDPSSSPALRESTDRFEVARARAALGQARQIVQYSTFKQLRMF